MTRHRVPVLAALHRFPDPEHSADPRVRELVSALRGLEAGPAPSELFRAELRAQLVAVTPRLVAEEAGAPDVARSTATRAVALSQRVASTRSSRPPLRASLTLLRARLRRLRLGRPLRLVTATLTVLVLLLGSAVWISRGALPGDALYGVKRASENVQYSLLTGDQARGVERLAFAKTRLDEVQALLGQPSAMALAAGPQAGSAISARTASLISDTLDSADEDVLEASQLLGNQSVRNASAAPLQPLVDWSPGQLQRIAQVVDRLPAGQLRDRASASANLVSQAAARARALQTQAGCACIDRATSDQFGPVPCTTCAAPAKPAPQPGRSTAVTPAGPTPSSTAATPSQTASPSGTPALGSSASADATSGAPGASGTPAQGSTAPGIPGLPLPSLPTIPGLPLPTSFPTIPGLPMPSSLPTIPGLLPTSMAPPVTLNSCGISIALGPLGLEIGQCGIKIGTS